MNREAVIIGLTGQTGAGKTTVANELKNKNCLIIDADKVARDVVRPGSKCLKLLSLEFGDDICCLDGSLDRSLLSKRAFSDRDRTNKLNEITHPFIVDEINCIIKNNKLKYRIIIIDAPLLIESGLNNICKVVISVVAPREIRLQRIIERDRITKQEAERRMASQNNEDFYKANSSYILDGSIDKESLLKEATELINKVGIWVSRIGKFIIIAFSSIFVVFISVFAYYGGYDFFMKTMYPLRYSDYVTKASNEYDVDQALIYGIIKSESGFDETAESRVGAIGLMQIMPDTFKWLQTHIDDDYIDMNNLLDPETNIMYGTYFMSYLLNKYGSEREAICAYNAGMGNVDKWLKDKNYSTDGKTLCYIPYTESRQYVRKVLDSRSMYNKLYFNTDKEM